MGLGWGGGKKRDKAESLVKVVYTCTFNYPPPQLLILGSVTVVVTNPVKVVLVIGIVCVCTCMCVYMCVCVCVCVRAHASLLSLLTLYAYDFSGSVIEDRVRECI